MKRIISILIFLIIAFGALTQAGEIQNINLKDYIGRYAFDNVQNSTIEYVSVELLSDSTLKAVASAGTATLILHKADEFKLLEYEGQVIFIRDETKLNVIGAKVFIPIANIEAEGKKEKMVGTDKTE